MEPEGAKEAKPPPEGSSKWSQQEVELTVGVDPARVWVEHANPVLVSL